MPWDAQSFAGRHNHALHGERASHAAHIANAVLRSGVPEGESIAIANKWAMKHRDAGGGLDPQGSIGGFAPSATNANPLVQGMIQRYAAYPTERLAELSSMLRGSPQGQIVDRILAQRRMLPNTEPIQQPQQQAQPQQQVRRGGEVKRAGGGPAGESLSEASPWWVRQEGYGTTRGGFLAGTTPGRADAVRTTAPAGSYVLPAYVVSALGEGNSLAGARVWQDILASGPLGTPMPRGGHGRTMPSPPRMSAQQVNAARGGSVGDKETPVALSHGEIVVEPQDVLRFGGGNIKAGHRLLDEFVMAILKKEIERLKKQQPPVGASKR